MVPEDLFHNAIPQQPVEVVGYCSGDYGIPGIHRDTWESQKAVTKRNQNLVMSTLCDLETGHRIESSLIYTLKVVGFQQLCNSLPEGSLNVVVFLDVRMFGFP